MSTMTVVTGHPERVSRAEFEAFRESRDDGMRYELLAGEILVTPAPATIHQRIAFALVRLLIPHIPDAHELLFAPVDVVLPSADDLGDTVLQPDLLITRSVDVAPRDIPVPPLLVVEILSPTTWRRDLNDKLRAYARAGVPHYWVVSPTAPSVTVFAQDPGRSDSYGQVGHAEGGAVLSVAEPLQLSVTPAALLPPTGH